MTATEPSAPPSAGPSVGALLAAARAERGLSVEDVSATTRIRATLIREIEADRFEPCGGIAYARGHVRNIAAVVGLDPGTAVATFDRDHADPERLVPLHDTLPDVVDRRAPNWWAAAAVAMGIVTVLAAVSVVRGGSDAPSDVVAADTPAAASTPAASKPAAPPPARPVAAAGVSVQLRVTGVKSWVRVTDGSRRTLFEGQLTTGQGPVFTDARQISVLLGNAGAVQLVVNGRNLGPAGGLGEVKRVVFGPGDPAAPAQG